MSRLYDHHFHSQPYLEDHIDQTDDGVDKHHTGSMFPSLESWYDLEL